AGAGEVSDAQRSFQTVVIDNDVRNYIMEIIEATRKHDKVSLGASPRSSIALMRASQVRAVLNGRDYVLPDDVRDMSVPVLAHRVMLRGHSVSAGATSAEALIREIVNQTPVPVEG
ncbi:MAG: magnesium chelatase, partial [Clostridiales bacterium]|nr:magnesium chelatase [Clostridiales bacterium]